MNFLIGLCQVLIIICALVCFSFVVGLGVIYILRQVLGVETLTPKKIRQKYSYDQGVPEQISNVMWRRGNPLPQRLREVPAVEEEENA